MKISKYLLLVLTGVTLACAPRPRTVSQFNVPTYTRPCQTNFESVLTIVLDENIEDNFEVRDNFRPMQIMDFRNSLKLTLYYTFEDSFEEVRFSDQPVAEGISLHLYRIRPFWKVNAIRDNVLSVGDVMISGSTYFVSSLIRYDGVIYHNGEKVKIIDEKVVGEKSETKVRRWNEAFVDGIKEMSEDLYRHLVEYKNNAQLIDELRAQ